MELIPWNYDAHARLHMQTSFCKRVSANQHTRCSSETKFEQWDLRILAEGCIQC